MKTRTAAITVVVVLIAFGLMMFLTEHRTAIPKSVVAIQIKWHAFDEGVALARNENKKILVDVYTDWCGWCKKMDDEVYTDAGVAKALSSDFVLVKLNAESTRSLTYQGEQLDEATFARSLDVTAYPTTVFLEPGAQPITSIPGYLDPKEFASILRFIGKDRYKTESYQEFKSSGESSGSH